MKAKLENLPIYIPIEVKYADIYIGMKFSQEHCPGALAIKRELAYQSIEFGKVYVDEERIAIYHRDGELLCQMKTPDCVVQLINDKDFDLPAKPAKFDLFLQETPSEEFLEEHIRNSKPYTIICRGIDDEQI